MAAFFKARPIRLDLTDDLVATMDALKGEYGMSRSAFARYLLRKGFASLGVSSDDLEKHGKARSERREFDARMQDKK